MKPYFFHDGIKVLAEKFKGTENIYLGIRPYGFHAGNQLPFMVYPMLLCQEIEKLGKKASFTFYVFINDWEQYQLDGPDPKRYPFNIYPLGSTFQYTKLPGDQQTGIVDHWHPIIENAVRESLSKFPSVSVKSVRNSDMKQMGEMKRILIETIKNPNLVADVLAEHTNTTVLPTPRIYALAVCPKCQQVNGHSEVLTDGSISHQCDACKQKSNGSYEDFDYWFYHKPLALPRISIFNIDLCITGADHYREGDFIVRQKLFESYKLKNKLPLTLYTQTVYGKDGQVMGKSKKNDVYLDPKYLYQKVINNNSDKLLLEE